MPTSQETLICAGFARLIQCKPQGGGLQNRPARGRRDFMTAVSRRHTISFVFASVAKQPSAGKAMGWIASPYGLATTPAGTLPSLPSLALTYKNLPVIFSLLSFIAYTLSLSLHRLALTYNITPHCSLFTVHYSTSLLPRTTRNRLAAVIPPPPSYEIR
jgi:hypothetical protein